MHRSTIAPPLLAALLALALCGGAPAVLASDSTAGADAPEKLSIWNDPTFQKQFLGSYGVQAEIEPRVTVVEREEMETILQLLKSDDLDGARAAVEKVNGPDASAVFDFTLGNIAMQQEDLDEAARQYRAAVDKFPSFRRAWKNLGVIHTRRGEFAPAIEALSQVIQLGGSDGTTFGLLGYAYNATEQYVSAESAYRSAVLLDPTTIDWRIGLTKAVFKQQKYAETVALSQELIDRFPDRPDFWLLQANAYIGMDKPMEAAKNFEMLLRMGAAGTASLYTLGDIYVNERLWDLAARAYGKAVEADPEQAPARAMRGVEILAQRGATEQAQGLLDTVTSIFGDRLEDEDRTTLLKLDARMAVAEGRDGERVAGVLEDIVALDPLDGEALMMLGQHYARSDDPERALFYYERAGNLEGFEADARLRQAQLLVDQQRYQEAVPLLEQAQEFEPRDEVGRYLEQVERIARSTR